MSSWVARGVLMGVGAGIPFPAAAAEFCFLVVRGLLGVEVFFSMSAISISSNETASDTCRLLQDTKQKLPSESETLLIASRSSPYFGSVTALRYKPLLNSHLRQSSN